MDSYSNKFNSDLNPNEEEFIISDCCSPIEFKNSQNSPQENEKEINAYMAEKSDSKRARSGRYNGNLKSKLVKLVNTSDKVSTSTSNENNQNAQEKGPNSGSSGNNTRQVLMDNLTSENYKSKYCNRMLNNNSKTGSENYGHIKNMKYSMNNGNIHNPHIFPNGSMSIHTQGKAKETKSCKKSCNEDAELLEYLKINNINSNKASNSGFYPMGLNTQVYRNFPKSGNGSDFTRIDTNNFNNDFENWNRQFPNEGDYFQDYSNDLQINKIQNQPKIMNPMTQNLSYKMTIPIESELSKEANKDQELKSVANNGSAKSNKKEEQFPNLVNFVKNLPYMLHDYVCKKKACKVLSKYLNNTENNIDQIIGLIHGNFSKVLQDHYGSAFFQKLIKVCNKKQRIKIIIEIKDNFLEISCSLLGSISNQKLIESMTDYSLEIPMIENVLVNDFTGFIYEDHAHTVIVKFIECIEQHSRQYLNASILSNSEAMMFNPNSSQIVNPY